MRRWLRLRSVERDVDEELAFHREQRLRELEARGYSPSAARAEADRLFGDERRYRRELVELDTGTASLRRWEERWGAVRDVVRHAARSVARSPGLSAGIVLAFALGIGANATMYGTVERLLLRPPPHIESPEEVRRLLVERTRPGGFPDGEATMIRTTALAWPDYVDFTGASGFADVAAYANRQLMSGRGEEAERLRAVYATASWWPLLGVQPALGRFYDAGEDVVGAEGVAVISHSLWQSRYGGRREALGEVLELGDGSWTIVGVAPRGFTGVDLAPVDVFLPFTPASARESGTGWQDSRNWHFARTVARLAPGSTDAAAAAEATVLHRTGRAEHIGRGHYAADAKVMTAPLLAARGPDAPAEASVARWLLGVAAIVLLIACLNVANLLHARMLRQGRETSIRLALGISRKRLVAQVVTEGLMLGAAGAAAAVLLARWGGTAVQRLLLPDVGWDGGLTGATLGLVVLLGIAAGCGSAAAPAIQATRRDVNNGLRAAAGGLTRTSARARAIMSGVQATLSVLLLVGAGLFVRSLMQVRATDLGLDLDGVAMVMPHFERGSLADGADRRDVYAVALDRVRALPSVQAASAARGIPFFSSYAYELHVPGVDSIPGTNAGGPYASFVDPGFFATLGIRLVRGRGFQDSDGRGAAHVVIISESFASALWPGIDPLGRCIHIGGSAEPCAEVVGVAADARRDAIVEELAHQYYAPLGQGDDVHVDALVVRATGDLAPTLREVRAALLAADPRIRFLDTMPLEDLLAPEMRRWHLGATLFTLFGLLALLVAAAGLHAVLAFDVAQRTREIGLRAALGAGRSGIVAMVVGRALRITAAGVAAGGLLAWALAPYLRHHLFHVEPRDPLTFAVVAVVLITVCLLAAGLPARRAARLDPTTALRAE